MTNQHSISVPQELLRQWCRWKPGQTPDELWRKIADNSAQWGADQELEACCEWIYQHFQCGLEWSKDLRTARRPKPPTLKEQALRVLVENGTNLDGRMELDSADIEIISRALEALPND
jgi:hypothetical protein